MRTVRNNLSLRQLPVISRGRREAFFKKFASTDSYDPAVAVAASFALHIVAVVLLLPSSLSSSAGTDKQSGRDSVSRAYASLEAEFRQRIIASDALLPNAPDMTPPEVLTLPSKMDNMDLPAPTSSTAGIVIKPANAGRSESAHAFASAASDRLRGHGGTFEGDEAGNEDKLREQYFAALRAAILMKWDRTQGDLHGCRMELQLRQGGVVVGAKLRGCTIDVDAIDQLEAAALMAQPLPYEGYERVFSELVELQLVPGSG